jgi:hypothetical protein
MSLPGALEWSWVASDTGIDEPSLALPAPFNDSLSNADFALTTYDWLDERTFTPAHPDIVDHAWVCPSLDPEYDASHFELDFTFCSPVISSYTASNNEFGGPISTEDEASSATDKINGYAESMWDLSSSFTGMSSLRDFSFKNPTDASSRIPSSGPSCADSNEVPERDLQCDWPQCSSLGSFGNVENYKSHLKYHARQVSNKWGVGQRCTWHGCNSKATHKNRNLFEGHLNNIHVNPLVCTVKHCKHKTPFRANYDLQRHIATVHGVQSKYKCPYDSCADKGKGFIRKDKWLMHLKERHEFEPCPHAHCQHRLENIPLWRQSTSKYIGKSHSNFECSLKSCKETISRFSESQLLEHLEIHHEMEWTLVLKMKDTVKAAGDGILRSAHLPQGVEVRDCQICGDLASLQHTVSESDYQMAVTTMQSESSTVLLEKTTGLGGGSESPEGGSPINTLWKR